SGRMKIGRATGGVSAVGKPGTANQFQRRELVAVPVLRRTHRSAFSRESRVCSVPPPPKPSSTLQVSAKWRCRVIVPSVEICHSTGKATCLMQIKQSEVCRPHNKGVLDPISGERTLIPMGRVNKLTPCESRDRAL